MASAFWVTNLDGVYFYSFLLNLIFAGVAWGLLVFDLRHRLGEGYALAGGLLFAVCLPLWVAVASGLETTQVLMISVAIWVTVERVVADPSPWLVTLLCVLMGLSVLARADGFIVPGVAILYLLLKRQSRTAALGALAVGLTFGGYILWRYHYYGLLFPITYYLKIAGPMRSRIFYAFAELKAVAILEGLLALLVAGVFVLVEMARRTWKQPARLAAELRFDLLCPVVWIAYWFFIGGDNFWDRFLIILFPLGIFNLLKFFQDNAPPKVTALVVVLLALLEVGPPLNGDPRFSYQFNDYDCWVTAGKFLARTYPGKTLATGGLGKMPFYSGLYSEDILGLTDPVLARRPVATTQYQPGHMKFDPDYTLARHPDVIANWIFQNGDLAYALSRQKYQAAGYHVDYLINSTRTPHEPNVISVAGADEAIIRQWIAEGYDYAVLTRQ
jgi:arabinofuranosyltransferase